MLMYFCCFLVPVLCPGTGKHPHFSSAAERWKQIREIYLGDGVYFTLYIYCSVIPDTDPGSHKVNHFIIDRFIS